MPTPEHPEMYGLSMTGQVRANNEDSLAFDPAAGFAIIADGMGGHPGGEVASAIAISVTLHEFYRAADAPGEAAAEEPSALVEGALWRANEAVLAAAEREPVYAGMGTTLLAACFHHGGLTVGNVGDCRLYRLREERLECVTRDHTLVAETGNRAISRHILTRAVGIREALIPDIYTLISLPGDLYLFCSDGLCATVGDKQIRITLADFGANLEEASKALFQLANLAGSPDNVSLILVAIH